MWETDVRYGKLEVLSSDLTLDNVGASGYQEAVDFEIRGKNEFNLGDLVLKHHLISIIPDRALNVKHSNKHIIFAYELVIVLFYRFESF